MPSRLLVIDLLRKRQGIGNCYKVKDSRVNFPSFACKVARRIKGEYARLLSVDEGRKRVLLIAASILAARKLSQFDPVRKVPATICAIQDAVRWAEQILKEIDERWADTTMSWIDPARAGSTSVTGI